MIKIKNKNIGGKNRCFIVAEAGVNHNGNPEKAMKLIDMVAEAGADAVKFQTWKTENIVLEKTDLAGYQKKNLGSGENQFEMLKKLELQFNVYFDLKRYAEEKGLILFSTMEDFDSVNFLVKRLRIPIIKVGSGDLTNSVLLRYTAKFGKPMILSTGMATTKEIAEAIKVVKSQGNKNIILLQCTTQYPCPFKNANISAMASLRKKFKTIVGFSDHTIGIECAVAAVALGAKVIEKHITFDKEASGPDHKASLDPTEFQQMVEAIRNVEEALGDGVKNLSTEEIKTRKVVIRKIIAGRDIKMGETINDGNVVFKRSNGGLEVKHYAVIIEGKKARKAIKKDQLITSQLVK